MTRNPNLPESDPAYKSEHPTGEEEILVEPPVPRASVPKRSLNPPVSGSSQGRGNVTRQRATNPPKQPIVDSQQDIRGLLDLPGERLNIESANSQPQSPQNPNRLTQQPAIPSAKLNNGNWQIENPDSQEQISQQHQANQELVNSLSIKNKNHLKNTQAPSNNLPLPRTRLNYLGFIGKWPFLATITVLLSTGLGFFGVATLLKLPELPNCPQIYWPTASASLRLYCAQLTADKQTAENLLEAIALVENLPSDHPLRSEIDRNIEVWSEDILKLAEESFQSGKLSDAIELARKIPENVSAYKLVEDRIKRWDTIWAKAEAIYQKAEQELKESRWHQAFTQAVYLTSVQNNYWASTKYDALTKAIEIAREDSAQLDKAHSLLKSGGVDNLLEAIKIAETISSNSYAYKEARDIISDSGNKLLAQAERRLDKGDWQTVMQIANQIPASLNFQAEVEDLRALANAYSRAQNGTVASLEEAIAEAQKVEPGRPMREKAQDLVSRWQKEIEDIAHLMRARDLARLGGINELMAAIAEAQLVPRNNPRFGEAATEIKRWTNQVQSMEDRPYIDNAEKIATMGDVTSLQEAINQANQIVRGRALYQQAQSRIAQWNSRIERLQDQPVIDRAEALAQSGDLNAAVAFAKRIQPGRQLYQEAKVKARQWVAEIERRQDQPIIDRAETLAQSGDLGGAIATLQQIKSGRILSEEASRKSRRWTVQLERQQDQPYIDQAQALANTGNLTGAVAIAEQIRPGRALSGAARSKIRIWQREINAQERIQAAYQLANSGTPDGLASAIRTARNISSSSSVGSSAREAANRWSYQLLALAQSRADSNVADAIEIAKNIPPGTDAYESARLQIKAWQNLLEPPPPVIQTLPNN